MNLTQSEERYLRNMKRHNLFYLLRVAIISVVAVNMYFCINHAREIYGMINVETVDPNAILLFKAMGWQMYGLFGFAIGMVFVSMFVPRGNETLLLKLYDTVQEMHKKEESSARLQL